jgi:hypothetical protein
MDNFLKIKELIDYIGHSRLMAGKRGLSRIGARGVPRTRKGLRAMRLTRPVHRTKLDVVSQPLRREGDKEFLEIQVKNLGAMTALFCEPQSLLEYRTDLTIQNNHISVPPGEARTITIMGEARPRDELGLSQEGWRISCWNTDDVFIVPDASVLLSVGRRDAMSQEFRGLEEGPESVWEKAPSSPLEFRGHRPDSKNIPLLLPGEDRGGGGKMSRYTLRFVFDVNTKQAAQASRLRIHTADQDREQSPSIEISANGFMERKPLNTGLGIQISEPAHLAFPATAEFTLPPGTWKPGENTLQVRVRGRDWFTWDALDLVTSSPEPLSKP